MAFVLFAIGGGVLTSLFGPGLALPLACVFLTASFFFNWLWRLFVFAVSWIIFPIPESLPVSDFLVGLLFFLTVFNVPTFTWAVRPPQKVEGAVFVTGCDSGMGFWTAALLADVGADGTHL